jgi:hypothetical protein
MRLFYATAGHRASNGDEASAHAALRLSAGTAMSTVLLVLSLLVALYLIAAVWSPDRF